MVQNISPYENQSCAECKYPIDNQGLCVLDVAHDAKSVPIGAERVFTISKHANGYYQVSTPNYEGGEVVSAAVHTKLVEALREIRRTLETLLTCDHCGACEYCNGHEIVQREITAINDVLNPKG